jgi:ribosomal protein S12 methylthiotransferase
MLEVGKISETQAKRVHLISLGCARNRVDAEVMLGSLIREGWQIIDSCEGADAVVVNTCGFIGPAKEESVNAILDAAKFKEQKPDMKLVVSGCLAQRYKRQLAIGLPEVDFFVGTDEFPRLPELLNSEVERGSVFAKRTNYLYDGDLPKLNTLAKHSAYVKVAEGCQHKCAFCIIPAIRGKLRSRPIENVAKEVRELVAKGVIEVNLIAQDLAAYGRDLGTDMLLPLLRELVTIEGLQWVRLLYVYPENISQEFMEFFASEPKLVKYLDVPMQHGSDSVLSRMNREVTRTQLLNTISELRSNVPGIAIRTSVMVGFPGETHEEFEELLSFIELARFDHLGCFSYSQEENTVAGRMKDQIDEETKRQRVDQVMRLQREISSESLGSYVGRVLPVLVTGASDETDLLMQGRLSTQAPEVDGVVLINDGPVKIGEIQWVEITASHDYDLVGRVIIRN